MVILLDTIHPASGEDGNVKASAAVQLHAWSIHRITWPRRQTEVAKHCPR
jgi:hypothetical protein